jgi:hypothetical protein
MTISGTSTRASDHLVSFDRLSVAVERAVHEGVSDVPALRAAIDACARDARDAAHPPQVFLVRLKASVRAGLVGVSPARVQSLMAPIVGYAIDAYYAHGAARTASREAVSRDTAHDAGAA